MKTVKFKDLPEKVQRFLNRVHVIEYPDSFEPHLIWLHTLHDWSKATDEERLAYAEWRYKFGVRLKDAYDDEEYDLKLRDTIFYLEKDPRSPHDILLTRHEHHTDITIYDSDKNKWAEIIEEPEKEEPFEIPLVERKYTDFVIDFLIKNNKYSHEGLTQEQHEYFISVVYATLKAINHFKEEQPTFKAGEYVEGIYDGEGSYGEFWFTGGKTKDEGRFICEDKHGGLLFFTEIRKIDPDKIYRAIAKEMMSKTVTHIFDGWSGEFNSIEDVELMLIEALKKGKEL